MKYGFIVPESFGAFLGNLMAFIAWAVGTASIGILLAAVFG